jgi:hypothetical protein
MHRNSHGTKGTCPFEVEAATPVQHVKVVSVSSASKKIHVGNFEVAPEMAEVPAIASGVATV